MGLDLLRTAGQECFVVHVIFDSLCQSSVLVVYSANYSFSFLFFLWCLCCGKIWGSMTSSSSLFICFSLRVWLFSPWKQLRTFCLWTEWMKKLLFCLCIGWASGWRPELQRCLQNVIFSVCVFPTWDDTFRRNFLTNPTWCVLNIFFWTSLRWSSLQIHHISQTGGLQFNAKLQKWS